MKQALGLIETKGLLAAIEACDVMLKTANVQLIGKETVGGGLVSITVEGDVGAVKTSTDAAASAVNHLNPANLIAVHVIARPAESLDVIVKKTSKVVLNEEPNEQESCDCLEEINQTLDNSVKGDENTLEDKATKEELTNVEPVITQQTPEEVVTNYLAQENQLEAKKYLTSLKVSDLRAMAKRHSDFAITKKELYKTSKDNLIEAFISYFNK